MMNAAAFWLQQVVIILTSSLIQHGGIVRVCIGRAMILETNIIDNKGDSDLYTQVRMLMLTVYPGNSNAFKECDDEDDSGLTVVVKQ